eukprot:369588-Pleurochrysis_carterae.AAC.1
MRADAEERARLEAHFAEQDRAREYADREAQLRDEVVLRNIFHHGERLAREVQLTEQAYSGVHWLRGRKLLQRLC